jgi:hypothetical protein
MQKNSRPKLRPMAVAVAAAFVAASSILLSAAQLGSPAVSGYGVDASVYRDNLPTQKLADANP